MSSIDLSLLLLPLFGMLVGLAASFTGLGGGFLMVPLLLILGYTAQRSVGTSFLAILCRFALYLGEKKIAVASLVTAKRPER